MIHIEQDLDIDSLIEEIEFAWCIEMHVNPRKAINLEVLYDILKKHFPQIEKYIDAELSNTGT